MTREELSELIEQQGSKIYGVCISLAKNRQDADDLYQDTFLKAAEKRNQISALENPQSYLIGIAIRIWKNQYRKHMRRQRIAPLSDEKGGEGGIEECVAGGAGMEPENQYLSKELKLLVREQCMELKEIYRLPLYLYYSAEMPIEDIASTLHIPKGTVKSRLSKARAILRKNLEGCGYEK